jgi:hypothetical protein
VKSGCLCLRFEDRENDVALLDALEVRDLEALRELDEFGAGLVLELLDGEQIHDGAVFADVRLRRIVVTLDRLLLLLLSRHEYSSGLPVAAIEAPAVSVAAILPIVAAPLLAIPGIPGIPDIPAVAVRTLDAVMPLVAFWPLYTIGAIALYAIGSFTLYSLDSIRALYAFLAISAFLAILAIVPALDALAGFAAISLIVRAVDRLCVARLAIVVRRRGFCARVALRHLVGLIRDGPNARAAYRPCGSSGALWSGGAFEIVVFLHCDLL